MTADSSPPAGGFQLDIMDFRRLARFVTETSGIKMPPSKRSMLEGRLRKRVQSLGFPGFAAYCAYLFDGNGLAEEAVHIVDAVTTNKTEFFREPTHFSYLADRLLPGLDPQRRRPLKLWSAACSTGAEPYTMAMILEDWAESRAGFDYWILATDLCTEVLATARHAIYPEEAIEPVPLGYRHRYLLRSRDRSRRLVRIAPELREHLRFACLNLMETDYATDSDFDIIFCRNVLIYFSKEDQGRVLRRLCGHLVPGGTLFLGHSEAIAGFDLPLKAAAPAVFVKV